MLSNNQKIIYYIKAQWSLIISMAIVYLKHQTLFQDPFVKNQCFIQSKFRPLHFGDTKTRKLIFIPKKMTSNFSQFYIRLLNFILFDQHSYELCFVENSVLKTGRIFVLYETFDENICKEFYKPHQNLSQFQVCPKYQILYMLLFCPEFLTWN